MKLKIIEEIDINREKVKEEILKLFTKIRNELHNSYDQLLIEVDNIFEKKFKVESLDKFIKDTKYPVK